MNVRHLPLLIALAVALCVAPGMRAAAAQSVQPSSLRLVVVVSRHGVRSPTDPNELTPYSARPWPSWQTPPGYLTPRGATLMTAFGASYRTAYGAAGLLPGTGCPAADSVFVWADVDERTKATADALLDGFAPKCGLTAHSLDAKVDPLFHPLPSLGKADPAAASAALSGTLGASPEAIAPAYGLALAKLDAILGCRPGACTRISDVPARLATSNSTGLASVQGGVDLASTAVEDLILAYADGKPASDIGWGAVDRTTLLELSQLHVLKFWLNTENAYAARALGSNLTAHVLATLDQAASGKKSDATRAPVAARFVAFVGHDTNLGAIAGLLRLRWLMPGYQLNDTPPGGALVFELRANAAAGPFVRVFYTAQSLDEMRQLSSAAPARVAVWVPGCPALDCPLTTFDRVVSAALDPAFVGRW